MSEHTPNGQPPLPSRTYLLQPISPLLFRDARPFGADAGAHAFSLPWPNPRTVAGALRTALIGASSPNPTWDKDDAVAASKLLIDGPFLMAQHEPGGEWIPYVPKPDDVVPMRVGDDKRLTLMTLRPQEPTVIEKSGPGTDWTSAPVSNVELRPMDIAMDAKPEKKAPAWWPLEQAIRWLATSSGDADRAILRPNPQGNPHVPGLDGLMETRRIHVGISPNTGMAEDGILYQTQHRVAPMTPFDKDDDRHPALALLARVHGTEDHLNVDDMLMSLGGEGGMVGLSTLENTPSIFDFPNELAQAVAHADNLTRLRLQFLTPAIFKYGTIPTWMNDGVIPGWRKRKVKVKLVGITNSRRQPVSGWRKQAGSRATSLVVPAGAVYFFETDAPLTAELLQALWLSSVAESNLHRSDGYGIVIPGLW